MNTLKLAAWASSVLALLIASYFSYELGYFEFLNNADKSKLSWLNLLVFVIAYLRLGWLLLTNSDRKLTEKDLDPGFEAAEYCMAIGMLGTVIGFILMTTSMAGVDFSDTENIKQLFSLSTKGMSTALFTTAVGIVNSVFLRFSHYLAGR
jgi:hypothetical protein